MRKFEKIGYLIADTGFWLGLVDRRDQYHTKAEEFFNAFNHVTFVLPWPIYYEVLRTRLIRNPLLVEVFEKVLRKINKIEVDDTPYRDTALETALRDKGRPLALVDIVIRNMTLDFKNQKKRLDCLITFNPKDFADICAQTQILMLSHNDVL